MFGDVPDEQQLHVIVFERHLNFVNNRANKINQ